MLDQWAASGAFDCICTACNDPDLVARSLKNARQQGLLIVTFDADTQPDARQFFVNMATYDAVAQAMVDEMAAQLEPKGTGQVGLLTSFIQAPNQSEWAKRIKAYAREKYPMMEILKEEEHGEDRGPEERPVHQQLLVLAKSLEEPRPPAADRDENVQRVPVHVPAADEADERHQCQVEVEHADQVERCVVRHRRPNRGDTGHPGGIGYSAPAT